MPFSILIQGYPTDDAPVPHLQGPAVQGMFLHLMKEVEPAVCQRLHDDSKYRPYALSPLGMGEPDKQFDGFRLPRQYDLRAGTPCYVRVTLLDDALFPTFARYFLDRPMPTFQLGETQFRVTDVQATPDGSNPWSVFCSYDDLIKRAALRQERRITLRFITPASFRNGNVDVALPIPRLVFQGYLKRFQECHPFAFLPDFAQQAELHLGVERLRNLHTEGIKSKRFILTGFLGEVEFVLDRQASPEFMMQAHLLADFAFFCGTGKKTTIGMGQTIRGA